MRESGTCGTSGNDVGNLRVDSPDTPTPTTPPVGAPAGRNPWEESKLPILHSTSLLAARDGGATHRPIPTHKPRLARVRTCDSVRQADSVTRPRDCARRVRRARAPHTAPQRAYAGITTESRVSLGRAVGARPRAARGDQQQFCGHLSLPVSGLPARSQHRPRAAAPDTRGGERDSRRSPHAVARQDRRATEGISDHCGGAVTGSEVNTGRPNRTSSGSVYPA